MLRKAHLTLHCRMSGYRWVTTPLWLSGSLRPFLYSSSVYFCRFFLISSASVTSLLFLSFIVPIFAGNVPLVSLFLEEISSLFHSAVFLFLWIVYLRWLSYLLAILWNSAFSWVYLSLSPLLFFFLSFFFSQLFVRPPQITTLSSCISFSSGWFWSPPPVQCYKPPSIVLEVSCLPDLIPWIYSSSPL